MKKSQTVFKLIQSGHKFKMEITTYNVVNAILRKQLNSPKVIKLFSCSTQLSMKISLPINMKMPTKVGIFIFISREIFMLSYI